MTHDERKNNTRIASAEILLQNTARRDKLVEAALNEGFLVDCCEAFDVSISGATGPEYWAIRSMHPESWIASTRTSSAKD